MHTIVDRHMASGQWKQEMSGIEGLTTCHTLSGKLTILRMYAHALNSIPLNLVEKANLDL